LNTIWDYWLGGEAWSFFGFASRNATHSSPMLLATDGITPPITFGQDSDPEILGTVTVGVHHLLD
jgi:hypothetical protein